MPRVIRSWLSAAITVVMVIAVVGVLAGFAWILLAEPAHWEYTEQGLALTETAAGEQFGVLAWFSGIGLAVSVVAGVLLERWRPADGWRLVPVIIAGTLIGAALCARVGRVFGPPDPSEAAGLHLGDQVPMTLELGAFSPLLVWVVGGLIGLGVSVYLRPREPVAISAGDSVDDR